MKEVKHINQICQMKARYFMILKGSNDEKPLMSHETFIVKICM